MDTTLTFVTKSVAAMPYMVEREPPRDNKVPVVKSADGAATLPTNKPFVAQVVTARLSGTDFPEKPGEIVPAGRTLRPYGTPMLPYENAENPSVEQEAVDPNRLPNSAEQKPVVDASNTTREASSTDWTCPAFVPPQVLV